MIDRDYFEETIQQKVIKLDSTPKYQQVTIFFLGLFLALTPVGVVSFSLYRDVGIKIYIFVLLVVMFSGGFFLMMPIQSLKFFKAVGDLLDHILPYLPGWRKKVSAGNGHQVRDRRISRETNYEGEERRQR